MLPEHGNAYRTKAEELREANIQKCNSSIQNQVDGLEDEGLTMLRMQAAPTPKLRCAKIANTQDPEW